MVKRAFSRYLKGLALSSALAAVMAGPASASGLRGAILAAPEADRPAVLRDAHTQNPVATLLTAVELLAFPDLKVRLAAGTFLRSRGPEAFPYLFRAMGDKERAWFAESILVDQETRITPFLTEMLGSANPDQRARAVSLLGKIRDPGAVPILLKVLKDSSRDVRIASIVALGETEDERVVEPLIAVFTEANPLLSEYVVQALEMVGSRGLPAFKTALRSDDARVRAGGIQVLRRLRIPETLPMLLESLGDPSAEVRLATVGALSQFGGRAAAQGLVAALSDRDLEVVEATRQALAQLGSEAAPFLLVRLKDPDPAVRRSAVQVLQLVKDPQYGVVPPLLVLLNDSDEGVRTYAVTTLMNLRDRQAVKPLVERLKVEKEIPWLIAYALQTMAEEACDELLAAVGNEQFCYTRDLILLRMGDTALDSLLARAEKGSGQTRITAIALLGQLGKAEVAPHLEALMGDAQVGLVAGNSLTKLGAPGWQIVLARARGPEGPYRRSALGAIASADTGICCSFLLEALGGDDEAVRDAAARAFDRLGAGAVGKLAAPLATLPEAGFAAACGVLCRITDPGAAGALGELLDPKPEGNSLGRVRLARLRQVYSERGGISDLREKIRTEQSGGENGGGG